jgi:hypothetical protein
MSDHTPQSQSWWLTLPGILTALGTLITAITGLYLAVMSGKKSIDPPIIAPAISVSPDPPRPDICRTLPVDQRPAQCLEETK